MIKYTIAELYFLVNYYFILAAALLTSRSSVFEGVIKVGKQPKTNLDKKLDILKPSRNL